MTRRTARKKTNQQLALQDALADVQRCVSDAPKSVGTFDWPQWHVVVELHTALDKVTRLQKDPQYLSAEFDGDFSTFDWWLSTNGLCHSDVSFGRTEEEGLCLRANENLETGSLLVTIPRKFILTCENIDGSPLGTLLTDNEFLNEFPSVALALQLIGQARTNDSFWKPYIALLPRAFDMPLCFALDELQELKPSPIFGQALRQLAVTARQYLYLRNLLASSKLALFQDSELTFNEFRWAMCVVSSRQNRIPRSRHSTNKKPFVLGLVPVWDLANHMPEGEITTQFNMETEAVECFAMRNFKARDQVYIYYGDRTSGDFLLHSGFVPSANHNDRLNISFGLSQSDIYFKQRSKLLAAIGLPTHNTYQLNLEQQVNSILLAVLRIFRMDPPLLETFTAMDPTDLQKALAKPINDVNEKSVCLFLETKCKLHLAQYTCDHEANQSHSKRRVLCHSLHESEMAVLRHTLSVVARMRQANEIV